MGALDGLSAIHTSIFNALEFPATQVPIGLDEVGMPVGIQVAAARHQDDLCLAVAEGLAPIALPFVPKDPVRQSHRLNLLWRSHEAWPKRKEASRA